MPEENDNEQVNVLLDTFGGKVVDDQGKDTGYRSPKQIETKQSAEALKGLLDVPEPENEQKTVEKAPTAPINAILDEALRNAKDGRSVIPVGKDKVPLISWKEFHTRIATEDEIRGWWRDYPEAQLGLVTGSISGIAVVDVEKEFGDYKKLNLPATMVSQTGSGGYHLFYQMVEGVRNRAKIGGQDVDIRGEGGYVIIPPSSNNAGEYKWLEKVETLPAFPVHIFDFEKPVMDDNRYEKRVDFDPFQFEGFDSGGRNDGMAKFIGSILNDVRPERWEELLWPIVLDANQKNRPPLPDNELKLTWDSICGRESTESLAKWDAVKQVEAEQQTKALIDNIKGDEVVLLREAAADIRKNMKPTVSTGFAIFDGAMNGGLRDGDLTVISGLTGQGKTSLGRTFTMHMCRTDLPVMWLSYEVPADIMDDKFRAMQIPKNSKIYVPRIMPTGEMAWVIKKIIEGIDKFKIRVVIIDLIDFLEPSKKKNSDSEALVLKRITAELKNLSRERGIIMFIMAHVRKQQNRKETLNLQDIAHSSSISQLSDYVFIIERTQAKPEKDNRLKEMNAGHTIIEKKDVIYTPTSTIYLRKNRYTGILDKAICKYEDEVFIPNESVMPLSYLRQDKPRFVLGMDG